MRSTFCVPPDQGLTQETWNRWVLEKWTYVPCNNFPPDSCPRTILLLLFLLYSIDSFILLCYLFFLVSKRKHAIRLSRGHLERVKGNRWFQVNEWHSTKPRYENWKEEKWRRTFFSLPVLFSFVHIWLVFIAILSLALSSVPAAFVPEELNESEMMTRKETKRKKLWQDRIDSNVVMMKGKRMWVRKRFSKEWNQLPVQQFSQLISFCFLSHFLLFVYHSLFSPSLDVRYEEGTIMCDTFLMFLYISLFHKTETGKVLSSRKEREKYTLLLPRFNGQTVHDYT